MNDYEEDFRHNFRPEMGAYNRAGQDDLGEKLDYNLLNPLEIFQISVDAISRKLINRDIKISEQDITIMLEKSNKLKYVKYKNPNAYVLGYISSFSGKQINNKYFKYTIDKVLPYIEDASILEPDVLRYARLWLSL